MENYILDENGQPVREPNLLRWAEWFDNLRHQRVLAIDKLPNGVTVSTVFLSVNHRFTGHGPPVLWETMIFGGDHDREMWRYDSREKARAGHAEAVRIASQEKPIIGTEC